MFIVTFNWDGPKTAISFCFYNYEFALKELDFLVKESEKFRASGLIKEYSVELKKE